MKVNAFERWCYRRILGRSWKGRVSTAKIIKRIQIKLHTELHFTKNTIKRKMEYAGHVLKGSSGLSLLQILEGTGQSECKNESRLSSRP